MCLLINYHLPFAWLLPTKLVEIADVWNSIEIHDYDDEKISALIGKYATLFDSLESQFTGGLSFPELKSCVKKAEKDCNAFFYSRYNSRT